jgi:nitroreductase
VDILDVIRNRRSDRHFNGRPVAQSDIDVLIEAFRWAPSSTNRQP